MLISTIWIYSYRNLGHSYLIRDLRGQNSKSLTSNISKTTNILKSIIKLKLSRIKFWTIYTFGFFLFGLFRELRVRPLKLTCDISRTVRNLSTVVEQEMYNIIWSVFCYQTEGTGPLNKGIRRIQSIWRISHKSLIFCYRL